MTPDRHGYVRCDRCGTLRPVRHLVSLVMHAQGTDVRRVECADVGVCTRLAGGRDFAPGVSGNPSGHPKGFAELP